MLARCRTVNARVALIAIPRPLCALRPFRAVIGRPRYAAAARVFHTATAEFTNLGSEGTLVTKEVSIRIGDPGETYVCIPTDIGYALQTGSCLTNSSSTLPKRLDRFSLSYFHETQHFALGNRPAVLMSGCC
jgi:hypothetical protein